MIVEWKNRKQHFSLHNESLDYLWNYSSIVPTIRVFYRVETFFENKSTK